MILGKAPRVSIALSLVSCGLLFLMLTHESFYVEDPVPYYQKSDGGLADIQLICSLIMKSGRFRGESAPVARGLNPYQAPIPHL